jgi:hypothetical protein
MSNQMDREQEKEKLFSEQVDQMLSGQEVKPAQQTDEDLRSALIFAQKMTALRKNPSPQFVAQLKTRLMNQLAAQNEKAREKEGQGWFRWFITHKPAWQAATGLAVVLIAFGIVWATGILNTQTQPPVVVYVPSTTPMATQPVITTSAAPTLTAAPTTTAPATMAAPATSAPPASTTAPMTTTAAPTATIPGEGMYVRAQASTNKTVYAPGENVKIDITLTNITSQPLKVEQPIFSLMATDTRQPVYTSKVGVGSLTLSPNQSVKYTADWMQVDFNNNQVPMGRYYIELEDLDAQGNPMKLTLSQPVQFSISP